MCIEQTSKTKCADTEGGENQKGVVGNRTKAKSEIHFASNVFYASLYCMHGALVNHEVAFNQIIINSGYLLPILMEYAWV